MTGQLLSPRLGTDPMPTLEAQAQARLPGAAGHAGSRSAQPIPARGRGAGGSCPATVGVPRRRREACKAGRASVEAGEVGDLQIPEESAFPVPSSFPPTWT